MRGCPESKLTDQSETAQGCHHDPQYVTPKARV
jgi:hypothetical protein